jgi:FKBP-type peptidyl-prolyl cis-trans isomerase FkpA
MVRFRQAMSRFALIVFVTLSALTAAACTDAPASPTVSAPYSQTDLRVGTGADALNGNTVSVTYTGWLYDPSHADLKGLLFDTSVGKTPFSFTIGSGQVIKGWDTGVPGMKVGGLRRLVLPPSLGYGSTRSGPIPANATLVFDIELLSVQ